MKKMYGNSLPFFWILSYACCRNNIYEIQTISRPLRINFGLINSMQTNLYFSLLLNTVTINFIINFVYPLKSILFKAHKYFHENSQKFVTTHFKYFFGSHGHKSFLSRTKQMTIIKTGISKN